ncbi:hypothetical protein PATSB16_19830 [Pandoraea thiooxydans]|nr:hypothetical protein PATSB16_19830 [Pandoraea thiooxydans]
MRPTVRTIALQTPRAKSARRSLARSALGQMPRVERRSRHARRG